MSDDLSDTLLEFCCDSMSDNLDIDNSEHWFRNDTLPNSAEQNSSVAPFPNSAEQNSSGAAIPNSAEQYSSGAPMHCLPSLPYAPAPTGLLEVKATSKPPQSQFSMPTIKLNNFKEVVANGQLSWNPAVGNFKDFIDVSWLLQIPNVMQYFWFKDNNTQDNVTWLLEFVAEYHPYDLISGSIFLDQSQAFEYKRGLYTNDFIPLMHLPYEWHANFRTAQFISRDILTYLFNGLQPIELFNGVHPIDVPHSGRNAFLCVRRCRFCNIQVGELPSITNGKLYLNPFKSVVADWGQSWNPARRRETKFIDIECFTRVDNVMDYFCHHGNDTPKSLDMDWLIAFIADRYPYAMISGEIFYHEKEHFRCSKSSGNKNFFPLTKLPWELLEEFAKTLFISFDTLSILFQGGRIPQLFSNVSQKSPNGKKRYIYRILRVCPEDNVRSAQPNTLWSDTSGGGDENGDGDSDDHNYDPGHPGHRQQQRDAHGGSDQPGSKRFRSHNNGAEGSSGEGDSDTDYQEQDSGDLSPLNASEVDVHAADISDMSLLSDIVADASASPESLESSAVIASETKDIADAVSFVESSEDVQITEQAKSSSSSEAAEGAMTEASGNDQPKLLLLSTTDSVQEVAKIIDDRKVAASAPPSTTSIPAANYSDTVSIAGTELYEAAAADTRTLIDEAETVQWNDVKTQRDGDSDFDDDDDDGTESGMVMKKASSTVSKYNRKEKTIHVANVGLGALTARTLTDVVAAMENPLMWDCPYVQLKDVLKKLVTRLTKDKEVGCDVDVVRVLLDMMESNRPPLDLSSKSAKLLGGLKPVTGATLLDAVSNGEIGMDVHWKVVDRDAVYVPRGRNPLYRPLVMAVYGYDDPKETRMRKLETMMSGDKMDHVEVHKKMIWTHC